MTGKIEFRPGTYDYSFQFTLPPRWPVEVEGSGNRIRCKAKVSLHTSMTSSKSFTSLMIPFIWLIDLNSLPELRVIKFFNSHTEYDHVQKLLAVMLTHVHVFLFLCVSRTANGLWLLCIGAAPCFAAWSFLFECADLSDPIDFVLKNLSALSIYSSICRNQ